MDLFAQIKDTFLVYVTGCCVSAFFIVMWFYVTVGIDKLSDLMLYPFKKLRRNDGDYDSSSNNDSEI